MKDELLAPVDVVMLGTFAMWNLGTLQARALPFARAMQSHNLNVAIVTTPWDMPSEAGIIDVIDGIAVINTGASSAKNPIQAVKQQLNWVRRLQPRLVHLMKPKGFGGMAARMLESGIPLVVDSDDWEGDGGWNDAGNYSWPQRRVFHFQETDLLKRANVVTAASTFLADRTRLMRNNSSANPVDHVALKPEHNAAGVFLVENGIETSWAARLAAGRTAPPSAINPPIILLYSRFAEFGANWLPDLIAALSSQLEYPATLRIIGPIPDDHPLPDSNSTLHIESLGYVARGRLPELLGTATLAVYPYEDSLITRSKQSVKLLELMAAGVPVIGSDVGDIPHVLTSTGVTLSGADPVRFASKVCSLLQQPERLDAMSVTASERIRSEFSFERLSTKMLEAYRAAGLA